MSASRSRCSSRRARAGERRRAPRSRRAAPAVGALTMDQAVAIALAAQPRRDRGAARHRGRAARRASRRGIYPNPVVRRTRSATSSSAPATRRAGAGRRRASSASRCTAVGVSEVIDVWAKRSARIARRRARRRAASACWSRTRCARSSTPCARRSPTSRASSPSAQLAREIARSLRRDRAPLARRAFAPATSPRPSCARSSSRGCATRTPSSTPSWSSTSRASKLARAAGPGERRAAARAGRRRWPIRGARTPCRR